ncbi:MAG: sugar ABC transporter permease [Defluviitaleaceae bacterium]|nr:sugar ABC transporter permease [Defluviitaleaceae bacterium]
MNRAERVKNNLVAYGFLSPWFIGFLLFTGGPIIASIVLSLTRWNLLGTPDFVGFQNYISMFTPGSGFLNSLRATFIYTIISVIVSVTASLFMATLLNFKLKFLGVFQFCFFIPAVMPSVALAFVFQLIFNQHLGILNYGLSVIGIAAQPNWLNDTFWVWVSLGIVTIFTYSTGQMMLIFNAALKDVPQHLYEAADIEGANFFQRFWHVTMPYISPIILFNVVVGTVNSFNTAFSIIFPLTGGGPASETMVLSLELYNSAFRMFNMGMASAVATVLFIIVASVGAIQFRISKKIVHYD